MLIIAAGGVAAVPHMSPTKASLSSAGVVGGLGMALGSLSESMLGVPPLIPLGGAEAVTLAALVATGAGRAMVDALAISWCRLADCTVCSYPCWSQPRRLS